MFWDMRVRSLEAQALEPIKALEEMRGDAFAEPEAVDMVVARLQAIPEYRTRFARAFNAASAVTAANLGKAIAAFERSLVALNSPFDRYVRGDTSAMTPLQLSRHAALPDASAARTATRARCSPTTRCTRSACRTIRACRNRTRAWTAATDSARRRSAT